MLKDHFLMQDLEMVTEHRDNLLKVCMNIQNCTLEGNFNHNEQFLQEINQSLKILMALNAKKADQDRVNEESVIRRNWF